MKINAIDYRGDVVTKINELLSPLKLVLFVTCAKRDVVHRPGCHTSNAGIRQTKQINDAARRAIVRGSEPKPVSRFLDQPVTECVSEQTRRLFVTFQSSRHTVESVKRMFRRNRAIGPLLNWRKRIRSDQFKQEPVRIDKSNHFFSETRRCPFRRN